MLMIFFSIFLCVKAILHFFKHLFVPHTLREKEKKNIAVVILHTYQSYGGRAPALSNKTEFIIIMIVLTSNLDAFDTEKTCTIFPYNKHNSYGNEYNVRKKITFTYFTCCCFFRYVRTF